MLICIIFNKKKNMHGRAYGSVTSSLKGILFFKVCVLSILKDAALCIYNKVSVTMTHQPSMG